MRRAISVGAFPGVLLGTVGFAWAALGAGWPDLVVVTIALVLAATALLALQRLAPAVPEWRGWRRDAPIDLAHTWISSFGSTLAARSIALAGVLAVAERVRGPWPDGAPLVLQLLLALLVSDLGAYVVHRLSHTWEPLWRLHALHHSSEQLHVLSAGRNHPVHTALSWTVETLPLLLLGAPPDLLAAHAAVTGVIGLLQHANVDYHHGPLSYVFATADLHRWHHSADRAESCTNFGNNLVVWDHVFGTWRLPTDRRAPQRVGIDGVVFPRNLLLQLASPVLLARFEVTPTTTPARTAGPTAPTPSRGAAARSAAPGPAGPEDARGRSPP